MLCASEPSETPPIHDLLPRRERRTLHRPVREAARHHAVRARAEVLDTHGSQVLDDQILRRGGRGRVSQGSLPDRGSRDEEERQRTCFSTMSGVCDRRRTSVSACRMVACKRKRER